MSPHRNLRIERPRGTLTDKVTEALVRLIRSGVYGVRARLPSEKEMADRFGVSRTVVRQALQELELEGVINRQRGKGTFISLPKISEGIVQKLTGFYQDMVERGLKPITKVLHQNVIPANEKVAQFLNISPTENIIDIQRLRFIGEEPI